jgi:hypothetical protein
MTTIEAIEVLKSNECACGEGKHFRTAFCRSCYYKLPLTIRRALYARLGCGFEQAYDLAIQTLKELGVKIGTGLEKTQQKLAHSFEFHQKHGE